MNYTMLLNGMISSSGLTQKDIAAGCKELGEDVTASYINILKKNEGRIPSDSVSRAIAKTCIQKGHCDMPEEVLVVQAYLDRAPAVIISTLQGIADLLKNTIELALEANEIQFSDTFTRESLEIIFDSNNLAFLICKNMLSGLPSLDSLKESISMLLSGMETDKETRELSITSDGQYMLVPLASNSKVRIITESEAKKLL